MDSRLKNVIKIEARSAVGNKLILSLNDCIVIFRPYSDLEKWLTKSRYPKMRAALSALSTSTQKCLPVKII